MKENLRMILLDVLNQIEQLETQKQLLNVEYGKMLYSLELLEIAVIDAEYDLSNSTNEEKEDLEEKLFDAQEKHDDYEEQVNQYHNQISSIDIKVEDLRDKFHQLKKEYLTWHCTHPICYNTGFFKGNRSTQAIPKSEANYSIDLCLECGDTRKQYRENSQKGDPNWYNPPYHIIEHSSDWQMFKKLKSIYEELYIKHSEEEAIEITKSKSLELKNNSMGSQKN